MEHYDSAGKIITEGDKVKFRGEVYTIKRFLESEAFHGIPELEFEEEECHTEEIPNEFSVDKV